MLLGSDCNLNITVDFNLKYDNGDRKTVVLSKDTKVSITYFDYTIEKLTTITGLISGIKIRLKDILVSREFIPSNDTTAIDTDIIPSSGISITVDSSTEFETKTYEFILSEIVDIDIIHEEDNIQDEPIIDTSDLIKPIEPIIPPNEYIEVEIKNSNDSKEDDDMINVECIEGSILPVNPPEVEIPKEEIRESVVEESTEETPVKEKSVTDSVSVVHDKVQSSRVTKIIINRI